MKKRSLRTLIIYDIPDNKERTKFSKLLNAYGERVQKSAFEAWLNEIRYAGMMNEIKKYTTNKENDVRVYRFAQDSRIQEINSKHSEPYEECVIV